MVGKRMLGLGMAALLCAATVALARTTLSVEADENSVALKADTTAVAAPARGPQPSEGPLAGIPPEAWAKMTPAQIQELAETALLKMDRGGIFPDAGQKPWNRVEIVVPVVSVITVFAGITLIVFFVLKHARNRARELHEQRMALIEKGMFDPALLAPPKPKAPARQRMMIWGLVLALGGLAWTIADILEEGLRDLTASLVVALVGVALILAAKYVLPRPRTQESAPPPSRSGGETKTV